MGKRRYKFVASFGENCACAGRLMDLAIRQESSPFDWLRSIPFKNRVKLICEEFADFLNKQYLENLGVNSDQPEYNVYLHKLYGTEFLHDFPSSKSLEESLPLIKAKYTRRIKRFIKHLKTDTTLLVFISNRQHPLKMLTEGIKAINKKYNSSDIALLYIEHNPTLSMSQTEEKTIGKNLYYIQINNSPTNNKNAFLQLQGNIPIINDIICRYALGITYERYCKVFNSNKRKILFGLAKLFSYFYLNSERRHDIRWTLYNEILNYLFK